jgi:transaldolase/glucose-6-phosphate isomerase
MDCRVGRPVKARALEEAHRRLVERPLSWMRAAEEVRAQADQLAGFAAELRDEGFAHVVLLGMGDAVLPAEVLASAFARAAGYPELVIVDTTDPTAIAAVEARVDLRRTLFVIADKSGEALETASLHAYFLARMREREGDEAGRHFVAITDEGSHLEWRVHEEGMRALFLNDEDVPDGFGALSYFGMVPAVLIGTDIAELLKRARTATVAWHPADADDGSADGSAIELGVALAQLAEAGRDKLTIVASPGVGNVGSWIEMLMAGSTGKDGRGILPVVAEPLLGPEAYGVDRQVVHVRLDDEPDAGQDEALARLEEAGMPVHRLTLRDRRDLGALFVLWEIAAATAAAVLEVDPFARPDVAEGEDETLQELVALEELGGAVAANEIGDRAITFALDDDGLAPALREVVSHVAPPDYVALQAWLAPSYDAWLELQAMREALLRRRRVATSEGFAPRLLPITGQLHKGGPDTGVCLQLVSDGGPELQVPGQPYTFARLKHAQSLGDLQALRDRGRRVLRVDVGDDPVAGLREFRRLLERVLAVGAERGRDRPAA